MEALEQAAYEVDVYENHIDILLSMHKDCAEPVKWKRLLSNPEPRQPLKSGTLEQEATHAAATYRPNFWARLFKLEARQRVVLIGKIGAAQAEDERQYQAQFDEWKTAYSEWAEERDIAIRILDGDRQAKLDAIEAFESFEEISHLGSAIQMIVHEGGVLEARVAIHGSGVIPTEIKSLLKSGKLSTKAMPAGRFNELHQDYVCSCALRVGRELLAILPDDLVIVTALDNVLNSSTGHMEEQPILSVAFSRPTIDGLNLETIDPSDAMKNFFHNMSFKKGAGFSTVAALDAQRFAVTA
ncbi:hypothetical protein QN375_17310 [Pseudomonas sp. MH9.2]|uniref:hypothetical protein n=1 Tax=unclassified Pseudomonas TaxID=196821 RepID=UPI002AC97603|nr:MULTISPECIES: hypothetical protein [unclassified Pseudomonas]MEB0007235.1 hypothetical protein [Pseudomonas sp. RTB2]MEB0019418.1 hypothetical protein [Pseudomonas sp. RTB3]MEB0027511.1 hypothetical protein [Pseudomonas sp. MH9.2]MEB0150393.1 hypothetical protein [Pseudomonas sp. CCC2.2]MEB0270425.1 hypothetical protein [Pseudomonas sp. 5B4]